MEIKNLYTNGFYWMNKTTESIMHSKVVFLFIADATARAL
jgi:hypothetical protein